MNEAAEQREFVKWYRATYPQYEHCLRVSLAGLNFGSGPKAARMAAWVRSQGICKGEADIVIALPRGKFGSLVIEHKAGNGTHTLTDGQKTYLAKHISSGNCAVSTRGLEALKSAVTAYMEDRFGIYESEAICGADIPNAAREAGAGIRKGAARMAGVNQISCEVLG